MNTTVKILKTTGWYIYAAILTILTIGMFPRFHLVTRRLHGLGGVRAGTFGGTHVYHETNATGDDFLLVSTWHGKARYPVRQIAYAGTGPLRVSVESTGGKTTKLATWQTRSVAAFVNAQVDRYGQHGQQTQA
jgi:hypothetical protein